MALFQWYVSLLGAAVVILLILSLAVFPSTPAGSHSSSLEPHSALIERGFYVFLLGIILYREFFVLLCISLIEWRSCC